MAHVKLITPGAFDFHEPVAQQIKVSRQGLRGADLDAFVKRASVQFIDKLASIKFQPGEVPIHLLAVGAQEYYGSNRNGDAFREAVCRECHPTFQKYARWYRDHCFPAGTPVVTGDHVRTAIDEIVVGDDVVTTEGKLPVTAIMRRRYTGEGVCIRFKGAMAPLCATADHPIYAFKRNQIHCTHGYSRLGSSGREHVSAQFREGLADLSPAYVPAKDLQPGDYCLALRPPAGDVHVPAEFAELVGWVGSEGYLGKRGQLQFTYSEHNIADITATQACLEANGLHVTVTPRPQYGCVMLSACSTRLSAKLQEYVTGVKAEKRLTAKILKWSPDCLLRLLGAYIDGDGYVNRRGQLRIRSSSSAMLHILTDVLRAVGVPVSMNWDTPAGDMRSPTNGKMYAHNGSGVVAVNSGYAQLVCQHSRKQSAYKSPRKPAVELWDDKYFLMRVTDVDYIELDEDVFNLEVAGPHNYIAGEAIVHNCNKDPKKGRGIIKASAYNGDMKRIELLVALNATKEAADRNDGLVADEEMEKLAKGESIPVSMACALPGTLVKVRRGFLPVEDIVPDDEVLTHNGRYRPVYATVQRNKHHYARISTRFCGRQVLEFTPDHEFYVARYADIPRPSQFNGQRSSDPTGMSKATRRKYRDQLHAHARWLPCGQLKRGDQLLMPIYRGTGASQLTSDDARIMGYYVAEGSQTSDGYAQFSCHKADDCVQEMPQLAPGRTTVRPHSMSEHACVVGLYDHPLVNRLIMPVGRGVRNKVVPQEVYDATTDVKLAFVAAWFNGDGWQDQKGLHWSTCSRTLSLELQNLLASVGMPATVCLLEHTSDLPDRPRNGVGLEYVVNVSNRFSPVFATRSKASVIPVVGAGAGPFITGDYLAIPVADVEIVEDTCAVHDISVVGDESFTAFGLAVHNCRVSHDVCSSCGNKAKSRADYCGPEMCKHGGCRDNLAKTFDDGHTLSVDNPDPTFFDISKVFRPADRIAYTLGMAKVAADYETMMKNAAETYGQDRSSSFLAEKLGVTPPLWLLADGPWTDPRVVGQLKVANQLINIEDELAVQARPAPHARAFLSEVQPLCRDIPDVRQGPFKLAHVVTALAAEKCLLPLDSFLAMLTDHEHLKTATERVADRLPGVYNRLASDPRLEAELRSNPYVPGGPAPRRIRHWVLKHAAEWSLARPCVIQRTQLATLRHPAPPAAPRPMTKVAMADNTEELAKQYALYQLGFLQAHANDPDAGFMQEMVVRANQVR